MSAITSVFQKPFAVMGVVNVTPDSFYDGGLFSDPQAAIDHGLRLYEEGADLLDVGGASSRPGAAEISPEEEINRVVPVVRRLADAVNIPLSVDTTSAKVARAALDAGATWINDISAGRHDETMASLAAERGCVMLLMHSRGTPQTMQTMTRYTDIVKEVRDELLAAAGRFIDQGVSRENIVIDPGIGFAKTASQNLTLLRHLDAFIVTGYPVLVGTSRKSFLGRLTGREPADRLPGTLGSVAAAYSRGVRLFRVHDVAATRDLLTVLHAVEQESETHA